MKPMHLILIVCWVIPILVVAPALGQDMRRLNVMALQQLEQLRKKAAMEKQRAKEEAAKIQARILSDRKAIQNRLDELTKTKSQMEKDITQLKQILDQLRKKDQDLKHQVAESETTIQDLVDVIRINAGDVMARVKQNPRSAMETPSLETLKSLTDKTRFPGMDDLVSMVHTLWDQIRMTGEVIFRPGRIIDRAGMTKQAEILMLGPFSCAYRQGSETGFLNYAPDSQTLYAVSRLPDPALQKRIQQYMDGQAQSVPVDVSRGAAIRLLSHSRNLVEQIPNGGPIIWPILGIFVLGIGIVLERILFLIRKRVHADALIREIREKAGQKDWAGCLDRLTSLSKKPIARVLAAGIQSRNLEREDMENALQEVILKEIPAMERFLSTLGVLAAIAPLLGLLGTVTGMINTFRVITLHGTGDPRLMAGGISEALLTTMLGLFVAIPLMIAHTLLTRAVDSRIGDMEEKAVSMINIIQKYR